MNLIVMAKNPVLNQVKTRLARAIGATKALQCYRYLLKNTFQELLKLPEGNINLQLAITPDAALNSQLFTQLIAKKVTRISQGKGNLGHKILRCLFHSLTLNNDRSICIGSDIAEIKADIILDAFAKLEKNELVIALCPDGGFWLLGINSNFFKKYSNDLNLLSQVKWSSSTTAASTIKALNKLKVSYCQELTDIDREVDYTKELQSRILAAKLNY